MVPEIKVVPLIQGTTATAATALTGILDTKGFDYAQINVMEIGTTAGGQITQLALSEGNTAITAITSATGNTLTTFTGGTAVDATHGFVLGTGSSGVSGVHQLNIDLRGRKRYLFMSFTPTKDSVAVAWANMTRAEQSPPAAVDATTTVAGLKSIVHG
jgi:hypothetical protein